MTIIDQPTHSRIVGDTLEKLGATLHTNGTAFDLTGCTVEFRMVDSDGAVIVDWASASIVSASDGTVEYDFDAADVDTAGEFKGWFRAVKSAEQSTWPSDALGIKITLNAV